MRQGRCLICTHQAQLAHFLRKSFFWNSTCRLKGVIECAWCVQIKKKFKVVSFTSKTLTKNFFRSGIDELTGLWLLKDQRFMKKTYSITLFISSFIKKNFSNWYYRDIFIHSMAKCPKPPNDRIFQWKNNQRKRSEISQVSSGKS